MHFILAVAGVENVVQLAVLADASSLSHGGGGGVEKSASGRDIVAVTMIDSPPVGEHVEIVLMVVAGLVLTEEAVLMFTEVVVVVLIVVVACWLKPNHPSLHAYEHQVHFLQVHFFLATQTKKTNKRKSKAGNYASSGFVNACIKINIKTTTLYQKGKFQFIHGQCQNQNIGIIPMKKPLY